MNRISVLLGIIIFFMVTFLAFLLVKEIKNYPNYRKYTIGIEEKYNYSATCKPEDYEQKCKYEYNKNLQFPIDEPAYAVLHYDKYWTLDKKLHKTQMEFLLKLLNDSSSYIWGEVGTPYFDRFVTFHNENNNCIGLTKISYDGQTYSTPSLNRMKWGLLSDICQSRIISILEGELIETDKNSSP